MRYVFDIETDGLLDVCTKVHSLVLYDLQSLTLYSFANQKGYEPIETGLKMLQGAQEIIGHNIIGFDIPALKKIYNLSLWAKTLDTLLYSHLVWPDIMMTDERLGSRIPGKLKGRYGLKAFGYRLGILKDEHGEEENWQHWSKQLQDYCEQDVRVNVALYNKMFEIEELNRRLVKPYELEEEFKKIILWQEESGVPFNTKKARELAISLQEKKDVMLRDFAETMPPNKKVLKTKTNITPFNPNSRTQIVKFFKNKYNWIPTVFTEKRNPKLDEEVLSSLPYPEAEKFLHYFNITKIHAFVSEGKEAWLNHVKNDRIHGGMDTMGTVTHRASHFAPNLGQIPSVRSFMGKEIRELFHAGEGMVMMGCDASGLELRMLAHFLYPFDGGAYARECEEGDVHTKNQLAAEIETRDIAKTFIYCFLYGGGDAALGAILLPKGTEDEQRRAGKNARTKFLNQISGMKELSEMVSLQVKNRGSLVGVDGRKLTVRYDHTALNTLLQNAGSVAVKQATNLFWRKARDFTAYPALHVHDEWQTLCLPKDAENLGDLAVLSIQEAGQILGLRCKLDGEYKIGNNWRETH